jgi:hypothetical protein
MNRAWFKKICIFVILILGLNVQSSTFFSRLNNRFKTFTRKISHRFKRTKQKNATNETFKQFLKLPQQKTTTSKTSYKKTAASLAGGGILASLYNWWHNTSDIDVSEIKDSVSYKASGGNIGKIKKSLHTIVKSTNADIDENHALNESAKALKNEEIAQKDKKNFVAYHATLKLVYYASKLYTNAYNKLHNIENKNSDFIYLRPHAIAPDAGNAQTNIDFYLKHFADEYSPDYANVHTLISFNAFLFGGQQGNLSQSSVSLALRKRERITEYTRSHGNKDYDEAIANRIIKETCALYGIKDNPTLVQNIMDNLKSIDPDLKTHETNTLLQVIFHEPKQHDINYIKTIDKENKITPCVVKYDDNDVYTNLIWTQSGATPCNKSRWESIKEHEDMFEGSRIFDDLYNRGIVDKNLPKMQVRYTATKQNMDNPDYEIKIVDLDGKIAENKEKFKQIEDENFKLIEQNIPKKKGWW